MNTDALFTVYRKLEEHFGDLHWWPAKTKDEVAIGAILVQNVSWANTAKAVERLKSEGLLSLSSLQDASLECIETQIVSTRFYKTKAKKLKAFASYFIANWNGDWHKLGSAGLVTARRSLLSVWGIGPETADDILLYAAELPIFVIDTYTKRVFSRLGFTDETISYENLQKWFMDQLPHDTSLFNQYHALIDALGHHTCLSKKPLCHLCTLQSLCAFGIQRISQA